MIRVPFDLIIDPVYTEQKIATPHTWHAAEMFLLLLTETVAGAQDHDVAPCVDPSQLNGAVRQTQRLQEARKREGSNPLIFLPGIPKIEPDPFSASEAGRPQPATRSKDGNDHENGLFS